MVAVLMELTVPNIYGLLLRSKLLSPEDARAMFHRWQTEGGPAVDNAGRFSVWMVTNRYLTEYQAALLARGHADGFFLDSYKILDRLGKGHMAGVYKAIHPSDQLVAIKVLPPSRAREEEAVQRFHREARLAIKLTHPNIVRVFQLGQAIQENGDPLYYIVMEYLPGETLEEIIARRGRLPVAEAVRLIYQALQGLEHLFSQGLVHRDLKPSNLMLVSANPTPDTPQQFDTLGSTLKIVDMGLSRNIFESSQIDPPEDDGLTRENTLLGTPDYMSPEQSRDSTSIDIRSDIYSLGCVLYQLLAGQIPFKESNLIRLLLRHATETPRPLVEFNPEIPGDLQQVVDSMMAKEPKKRPSTPEVAARALKKFLVAGYYDDTPNPDSEVKLRNYLKWLKSREESSSDAMPESLSDGTNESGKSRGEHAGPSVNPPPISAGGIGNSPSKPTQPSRERSVVRETPKHQPESTRAVKTNPPLRKKGKSGSSRRKQANRLPANPSREFDVELVSPSSLDFAFRSPFDLSRLDRRDLFLFGLGVLAGGIAVAIGCLFALKRGTKPTEDH